MAAFKTGVTPEHKPGGYPRMSGGPPRNKFVHILVAEAWLRRPLRKDEHVHHKDGNTRNPVWTNLLILGESVHGAVSVRQYHYLKQKYSAERAAYWAYFDVTGETYAEYDERMKGRWNLILRKCKAYRCNDQMVCPGCGLIWDIDDEPNCKMEEGNGRTEKRTRSRGRFRLGILKSIDALNRL